jgi:hypothetical protein
MADPELKEIARRHYEEDAGHDQWFVHDMAQLECERDLAWVSGPEHRVTRDISYRLIAALLGAGDDRVRWAVPLVLEASAQVFFGRVIGLLARAGFQRPLLFYAEHHREAEAEHDVSSEEGARALDQITFEPERYEDALALMHCSFDLIEQLAAHLDRHRVAAAGRDIQARDEPA